MISFYVEGNPLPKQSFRVVKKGKVSGYTDPRIKAWQDAVGMVAKFAMAGEEPLEGDLQVSIQFYRENRRKVDLDNLSKAILDSCNKIVWKDDKQVVRLVLEKHYDNLNPGVYVEVDYWDGVA